MTNPQKDLTQGKIDTAIDLIKDLLIAQLAAMDFGNEQIKKVVGKIDNNRLRRIIAVRNKIVKQKAKQNKKHGQ